MYILTSTTKKIFEEYNLAPISTKESFYCCEIYPALYTLLCLKYAPVHPAGEINTDVCNKKGLFYADDVYSGGWSVGMEYRLAGGYELDKEALQCIS